MKIIKSLDCFEKSRKRQKLLIRLAASLWSTAIALIPTILLAWVLVPMANQNRVESGFGGEWFIIIAVFATVRAAISSIVQESKTK